MKVYVNNKTTVSGTDMRNILSHTGFIPPFLVLKGQKRAGFTLLELIVALVVISVMLISSSMLVNNMISAKKYVDTMGEIEQIAAAMVGDPYEVQTGHQSSFGYWEVHRAFPSGWHRPLLGDDPTTHPFQALYELICEPKAVDSSGPTDLIRDEWGFPYHWEIISLGGPFVYRIIESYGWGSVNGGGGASQDIEYIIDTTLYNTNQVRITMKDANGTLLRGLNIGESIYYHHIDSIQMVGFGDLPQPNFNWSGRLGPGPNTSYTDGYFTVTNVPAGYYILTATPVEGTPLPALPDNRGTFSYQNTLAGFYDPTPDQHRGGGGASADDLNDNNQTCIRKVIVVYPRGSNVSQHFEVRFPGDLSEDEIASYDMLTTSGNLVVW